MILHIIIISFQVNSRKTSKNVCNYTKRLLNHVQVDADIRAISTISGSNNISGVIYFTQTTPPAGSVTIRGVVRGLKPGKHSIHINQLGDLRNSCLSTGGHYNPYNVNLAHYSLNNCDMTSSFMICSSLMDHRSSASVM